MSSTGSANWALSFGHRSCGSPSSCSQRCSLALLPLKDPNELFADASRQGPSAAHWFGTDNIGRDVFSRTIYGARRSLLISTVSAAIGLLVGGTLGLVSGFYRRGIDATISAIVTILLSIPGLVLVLALMAAFAPPDKSSTTKQTFWAIVALSILVIPALARITRGQTTVWSDRDFVMASRTLGARNKRMMFRDVLPNMIPTMFSFAFLLIGTLILVEAALAFFGVSGVSWGVMIESGRRQLLLGSAHGAVPSTVHVHHDPRHEPDRRLDTHPLRRARKWDLIDGYGRLPPEGHQGCVPLNEHTQDFLS